MGKFVIIFLLCAFMAMCSADDVKEPSAIDELHTAIEARINEVKNYINKQLDEAKLKEFAEKFAENSKKLIDETQADFQSLTEKKP